MNAKFFDVKKEKQDSIINAALKTFSECGYKKASTDVIVKEAGISKGLLFHYFDSKQGLYDFIFDYSVKYMSLELTQSVKKGERDFFEIQRMIEQAKTVVMKNYPYMQQFLSNVKFENNKDAVYVIGDNKEVLHDIYNQIYKQADMTRFSPQIDVTRVINMISWMSQGFIRDRFNAGSPNLDEMNEEFGKYLAMLRDNFYQGDTYVAGGLKTAAVSSDSIAMEAMKNMSSNSAGSEETAGKSRIPSISELFSKKETSSQRRPDYSAANYEEPRELTFEERLAAGKRPLVDIPSEPKPEEKKETDVIDHETDNKSSASEFISTTKEEFNKPFEAEHVSTKEEYNKPAESEYSKLPEASEYSRFPEKQFPKAQETDSAEEKKTDIGEAGHEGNSSFFGPQDVIFPEIPVYIANNSTAEKENHHVPASEREVRQINVDTGAGFVMPGMSRAPENLQPLTGGYKVQRRSFAEVASQVIEEENAYEAQLMTEEERRAEEIRNMGPAPVLPEYHAAQTQNEDGNEDGSNQIPPYYPLIF